MRESGRGGDPVKAAGADRGTGREVVTVTGPTGRTSRQFQYLCVDRDDLIVELRVKGRSFREIAREVGCSFGTARKVVRTRMPEEGAADTGAG